MCIIAVVLLFTHLSHAQQVKEMPKLIKDYVESLKSQNREAINQAWLALNNDSVALSDMKANYPSQFNSYQLWGKAQRARQVAGLSTRDNFQNIISGPQRSSSGSTGSNSNSDVAARSPNQVNVSNSEVARRSSNQDRLAESRISNGQVALRNANQVSRPNKVRGGVRR